jgi:hypothetical protein
MTDGGDRKRGRDLFIELCSLEILGMGRRPILPSQLRISYLAAAIESTRIVLVVASSVPTTVTLCPANFSGACWSLNV